MNVITDGVRIPIKCWASSCEDGAAKQMINMANMPCAFHHVAAMPDAHQGYGVCIGGVLVLKDAICPNAVGVDIGCGMHAVQTDLDASFLESMEIRREFQMSVKSRIPVGEGRHHNTKQVWYGFDKYKDDVWSSVSLGWPNDTDYMNLATLGGGNHFIELQKSEDGKVWMMLHSGSRNLGKRIADFYHKKAKEMCAKWFVQLPDEDLAFLPIDTEYGCSYLRDMNFALDYARESRTRMMALMVESLVEIGNKYKMPKISIVAEHDVHHNYAVQEIHFGERVWVHRKGATSAKAGEIGIIPGSMGTSSYIVEGLGNEESFCSCSHGAGRRMSRSDACRRLTVEECDRAMDGIVCERWNKARSRGKVNKLEGLYDLSEAPGAYKDIDEVIANESDLVRPIVKLSPLASLKG